MIPEYNNSMEATLQNPMQQAPIITVPSQKKIQGGTAIHMLDTLNSSGAIIVSVAANHQDHAAKASLPSHAKTSKGQPILI